MQGKEKALLSQNKTRQSNSQDKDKILVLDFIRAKVEKGTGLAISQLKTQYTEEHLFYISLKHITTTKKALCKALDINIDNACRYKRSFEKSGLLMQSVDRVYCPYTKRFLAHLISTNPDEFGRLKKSNQLSFF